MAKHFSKRYGNKGRAFNYQSEMNFCSVRIPDATSLSLPQEQAVMLSMVRIQQKEYLILCTLKEGVANTCICLTTHPCSWKTTTVAV